MILPMGVDLSFYLRLACPKCQRPVDRPCRGGGGDDLWIPHAERLSAVAAALTEDVRLLEEAQRSFLESRIHPERDAALLERSGRFRKAVRHEAMRIIYERDVENARMRLRLSDIPTAVQRDWYWLMMFMPRRLPVGAPTHAMQVRFTTDDWRMIKIAAAHTNRTPTDFVRHQARIGIAVWDSDEDGTEAEVSDIVDFLARSDPGFAYREE